METPPVLFIVFNRPETARRVFGAIREARPSRLFVAADGPRQGKAGERELCAEVREMVTAVDWPCDVHTLFREENLGCKRAVSSAIDWFFQNNEMGIILEDDCLPHPTFFPFTAAMLERYKDEDRVRMVAGSSMLPSRSMDPDSYFFSRYFPIWGWATWRRAWKDYDISMKGWPQFIGSGRLDELVPNRRYRAMLKRGLEYAYRGDVDTWDYQWVFSSYAHDGLCLTPGVNLISNIGMLGTHMSGSANKLLDRPARAINYDPLDHPIKVEVDVEIDGLIFERIVKSTTYPEPLVPLLRIMYIILNKLDPIRWERREFF